MLVVVSVSLFSIIPSKIISLMICLEEVRASREKSKRHSIELLINRTIIVPARNINGFGSIFVPKKRCVCVCVRTQKFFFLFKFRLIFSNQKFYFHIRMTINAKKQQSRFILTISIILQRTRLTSKFRSQSHFRDFLFHFNFENKKKTENSRNNRPTIFD